MIYYKSKTGEVFAYETEASRQEWGPDDLVAMTPEEVDAHLNPAPTPEQLAQLADTARAKRDRLIESVRWRIKRHSDELALCIKLTEPLEPLLQYVHALRNVPQQSGFPSDIDWPANPLGNA